jgi:hypothetical protein
MTAVVKDGGNEEDVEEIAEGKALEVDGSGVAVGDEEVVMAAVVVDDDGNIMRRALQWWWYCEISFRQDHWIKLVETV